MQTYLSPDHRRHAPRAELHGGEMVPPFESPGRVDRIVAELAARGFPAPIAPGPVNMAPVERLHDAGYLAFLRDVWAEWRSEGFAGDVIAANYPARRMQTGRPPRNIDGKVGYYALASETAMTEGTWAAALSSAASAQAAQAVVAAGARGAFALCRPPGHHAARDMFGGYCFLNNAAIAAEMFAAAGARTAVLDIDFHHGNGTQDLFWDRGDVFFASLHGRPEDAFPYFLGYADETGAGAGEGTTANYPLPEGTGFEVWGAALDDALARLRGWGAEALVVSLGVDAFRDDPISFFRLESDDFTEAGRRIGGLGLPTVFCMEGGYAVAEVGRNTVNVLAGFAEAG